jgi:hypothetical protein
VRALQNDADPARTIEPCLHRPAEWVDRNATLSILIFGNYGESVLRTYIATMTGSIAHRPQRSGSHERAKICITPFTLLLDHFLQMLADSK